MGLFQSGIETYDACKSLVREYRKDLGERYVPLAPICHQIGKSDIEITLDRDGNFITAERVDDNDSLTIYPVTEESSSRTSSAAKNPHPLCDQLSFLLLPERLPYYIEQLENWMDSEYSHQIIHAVFNYVIGNSIENDLLNCELLSKEPTDKEKKQFIRWKVLLDDCEGASWKNKELFNLYSQYYLKKIQEDDKNRKDLCILTGKMGVTTELHPKNIAPNSANAKLISSNDSSNYVYRGRFIEPWQSATISFEASQKAHNALSWIIRTQGLSFGGKRTFVCWNPNGKELPKVTNALRKSVVNSEILKLPSDYYKMLDNTLKGYITKLPTNDSKAVISIFEAATKGRLSILYFNELKASDFLDRLYDWDKNCCWHTKYYGIQAPSIFQIVNYAYGKRIGTENDLKFNTSNGTLELFKTNDNLKKNNLVFMVDNELFDQQIQRMIISRIEKKPIPYDIVRSLCHKASNLAAIGTKDNELLFREKILSVACSVIKKYHHDKKEDYDMSLEKNKNDLSYQYGRLLAVLEKIERDTFKKGESREPNAIRLQTAFVQRPLHTFKIIEEQLERAYYPQLAPNIRNYYKKLIGEIIEIISKFPETNQRYQLKETYLLGYYLQRNELYTSKKDNKNKESEEL